MNFNFNDPNIINQIIENAGPLIKQAKSRVLNHAKFKILKSNHLEKYWMKRTNKKNLFTIYLKESLFDTLDFQSIETNLNGIINKAIHDHNFIEVSETFSVLNAERLNFESTQIAKRHLKDKSDAGYCVFFFGKEGVDVFVKGESVTDLNFFYNNEDLERFYEKKDISQIKEVFKSYQNNCLRKQFEYSRFFLDKGTIESYGFDNNTLLNKPEKFMRDHLRDFLADRIHQTFKIEIELEASKREIDIYTEVNGEFYFFEIKWLGKSVNKYKNGISSTYTDSRARDGVKQTIEYIEELVEVMRMNVKTGYLVIFDAREVKQELDYKNFTYLDPEIKKYMDLFDIIPPLELNNTHPA
ncbi:hypothetical protein [Lysinibacillus sp. NPDC092081]|uniref:hypothetical protein n=1 Tax=Lysinibacillus sp. NPDC092081 TaxID=3364131 RepID=UPI0037F471BD